MQSELDDSAGLRTLAKVRVDDFKMSHDRTEIVPFGQRLYAAPISCLGVKRKAGAKPALVARRYSPHCLQQLASPQVIVNGCFPALHHVLEALGGIQAVEFSVPRK